MAPPIRSALRHVARAGGWMLLGGLAVAALVLTYVVRNQSGLSLWHHVHLDEEFTTRSDVEDFAGYLALEERLFAQLEEQVYSQVPVGQDQILNRYSRGSLSDPGRWPRDWNRTHERPNSDPVAGVLLLHGLSDSPYSLRALGERLSDTGAWVLALRVPGHGTAPSGLTTVHWEDMAAAVALAARHLDASIGEKPFYVVGYSNGGALAVEYALSTLEDPSLPTPAGLVLLSPEIGVTGLAFLASWQRRLGRVPGLEKLEWNSIGPEYDPFKYNSFAVNAGDVAYRITSRIQSQLDALSSAGQLGGMPPVLAFQSAVDATVSATTLAKHLFERLPSPENELVLFDLNRRAGIEPLLKRDPATFWRPMVEDRDRGFELTLITNASPESVEVVAKRAAGASGEASVVALDERWPREVYSLAHIALPFRPDDPVYGGPDAGKSPGVQLGSTALHGERGVLHISGGNLLRMHWNPFYEYLESQVLDFMQLRSR